MYERSYGEKYEQANGKTTSEIAAMIRADIKAAVKAGDLPKAKYLVRSESYSMGSSINVVIADLPFETHVTRYDDFLGREHEFLTDEAKAVEDAVKAIHWAYNHNGSDSMTDYFDVNYYGDAKVEDPWSRDFRLREAERKRQAAAVADERREIVEFLVARGYKKGRLRRYSFESLVAAKAKIEEREAEKVSA